MSKSEKERKIIDNAFKRRDSRDLYTYALILLNERDKALNQLLEPSPLAAQLATLVLELAEAVDNTAEDIGGSRPQIDILRDAMKVATKIKRNE